MSGGVGPVGDSIKLPGDGEQRSKFSADPLKKLNLSSSVGAGGEHHRFFSLRQLNVLAAMIVLSASGLIHLCDAAFAIFSLVYVYFLTSFAFPPPPTSADTPVFNPKSKLLRLHVMVSSLVGLVLPTGYILNGMVGNDQQGVQAAAPHLFLLAAQVFLEGATFSRKFSLPVRAFVPVLFNARRMFALAEWARAEVAKPGGAGDPWWRLMIGRGLALANLAFWAFNLFGFLIPVYLPRTLMRYYGDSNKSMD